MFSSFIKKHRWFIKESPKYLGYNDYVKAKRKMLPFMRAYIKFMWLSRNDKDYLYD